VAASRGRIFSSINATLPAAQATGRLTLRPFSIVKGLIASGNRVTGVHVIDAQTRAQRVYSARVVFLCASALESARILLNSGIGNSSGQVGRNVMDHIKWGGASGVFDGWTDRRTIGERPNGVYVPRFRNVTSRYPDFIRGYGFQGGAGRAGWHAALHAPGIGPALKARLTELGPWSMASLASARCCRAKKTAPRCTRRWSMRGASPRCTSNAAGATTSWRSIAT